MRRTSRGIDYLVKWQALPYEESTWEDENAIAPKFAESIKDFRRREKVPSALERVPPKVGGKKQTNKQASKQKKNRFRPAPFPFVFFCFIPVAIL